MKLPEIGNLIKAVSGVRIINDCQDNLNSVLRLVMVKIGLRAHNFPAKEEKQVLIDHIRTNYGGHTVAEIKLAFDMAIAGNLDVEINCFENFSCLYFSTIMNAYRKWAKENYKQIPQKELPAPKEEPMTDEEFIEMNYKTWKNRPALGTSTLAYEALERMGKIKLTIAEKKERYEQAEAILKGRMATEHSVSRETGLKFSGELEKIFTSLNPDHWKERVRNECRRIEVENYFKTL